MGDVSARRGIHRDEDERKRHLRSAERPRRYVARHWLLCLRPVLRYSITRDAFVLRGVGGFTGPVLRPDRRRRRHHRRQQRSFDGVDRRRARAV